MMGNSRIRSKVVKSKEEVERQLILHYIDKTIKLTWKSGDLSIEPLSFKYYYLSL